MVPLPTSCTRREELNYAASALSGVDKSGFAKAAQPVQDQLASELGPHAVKILKMVRDIK